MRAEICVAGFDLESGRVVRPLQWTHHNWPRELAETGSLRPGTVVRQRVLATQDRHGFPHETDDLQFERDLEIVTYIAPRDLYDIALGQVDPTVRSIFGALVENKYVVEGCGVRSLGSVARARAQVTTSPFLSTGRVFGSVMKACTTIYR